MIKVFSHPHTKLAACILVNKLNELGVNATLVDKINAYDNCLHIIYNASAVKALPKNYIVYQTEVPGSTWFNKRYIDIIKRAHAVWDYSVNNTKAYEHSKLCIVTPGIAPQQIVDKEIDVLFYGCLNGCEHRKSALKLLSKSLNIKIVDNALEGEIWHLLNKSKAVVNIHYYKNAPLEVFRINEALSFNCHVVSETSVCGDNAYEGIVCFSGVETMSEACIDVMNKPFEYNLKKLDNTKSIRLALESCV